MEDNDKDDKDDKGISALGLDRDLGFSLGHQGHWRHDDDDNEEDKVEDDDVEINEVEDNDKEDNDNKDLGVTFPNMMQASLEFCCDFVTGLHIVGCGIYAVRECNKIFLC